LLFAIRRDARLEDLLIRELACRHRVGRPTMRQALLEAEPPPKKPWVRSAPRLEPFSAASDAMLVEDLTAPRKQKYTARSVFARLADEHGATGWYSTVRNDVPWPAGWQLMLTLDGGRRCSLRRTTAPAPPMLGRFGLEATVRPSLALDNTCSEVDEMVAVLHRLTNSGPRSPA
jgi:hypothetical protein